MSHETECMAEKAQKPKRTRVAEDFDYRATQPSERAISV